MEHQRRIYWVLCCIAQKVRSLLYSNLLFFFSTLFQMKTSPIIEYVQNDETIQLYDTNSSFIGDVSCGLQSAAPWVSLIIPEITSIGIKPNLSARFAVGRKIQLRSTCRTRSVYLHSRHVMC